jgi:predicted PurR-regulated permease PerM
MPETSPLRRSHAFVTLLVLVSVAFVVLMTPFYAAVMWGAIIGLLFAPVQRRLAARLSGRRTAAASLTMVLVVLMVIVPLALLTQSLAAQAARFVQGVQSGEIDFARSLQNILDALPLPLMSWLQDWGLGGVAEIQQRIAAGLGRLGRFVATQALAAGQDTLHALASFFVALYVAFFMLRDGPSLASAIAAKVPLPPADRRRLAQEFSTVVRATVKGNVVVAAVQGTLGGLAFWALGINGALLWGTVMAVLSLLPAVGAALVWLPAALYLLASGALAKGIALIVFGAIVIGLVDNVLRPILVGKDTKLPDWLVLVSTLGGMSLFGIHGFVIGPVVAAMFVAVWRLYGGPEEHV